jgi:predicted nucleotide-binding protein
VQTETDELARIETRCLQAASLLTTKDVKTATEALSKACDQVERSWSRSWIGYQSRVHYAGFQPQPPGAIYSIEWGSYEGRISNPTRGDWHEYAYDEIVDEVLRRAGKPDQERIEQIRDEAVREFEICQEELLATLDALLAHVLADDARLRELREMAAGLKPFYAVDDLARAEMPKEIRSIDRVAMGQGIHVPAHVKLRCWSQSILSSEFFLKELAKAARQAALYLRKVQAAQGSKAAHRGPRPQGKVFIGHGASPAWRDLKDLLQDRLGLHPDEFNLEAAAGKTTKERLEEMLDHAAFAFLVMTAEDEHADSTRHARENVIHEVGLFQGRLGFRLAIVLLEEGCAAFSNIDGLVQIRFPRGNIKAKSEEIRQVLEREGLLQPKA